MFYKALNKNLIHHGFQFKEGLNVDTVPFNPKGDCEAGGLYFTNKENILYWAWNLGYNVIGDVTVPEDAKTYQGDDKTKWKADKLILSNIRPIEDFVSELTTEEFKERVKKNESILKYVKDQTPELCELAVLLNLNALQYVKEQTPYICELAVRRNGYALRYVREQTPELCEIAVKQNGEALVYVKEQTPRVCELAVRQNGNAFFEIKKKTFRLLYLSLFG